MEAYYGTEPILCTSLNEDRGIQSRFNWSWSILEKTWEWRTMHGVKETCHLIITLLIKVQATAH